MPTLPPYTPDKLLSVNPEFVARSGNGVSSSSELSGISMFDGQGFSGLSKHPKNESEESERSIDIEEAKIMFVNGSQFGPGGPRAIGGPSNPLSLVYFDRTDIREEGEEAVGEVIGSQSRLQLRERTLTDFSPGKQFRVSA